MARLVWASTVLVVIAIVSAVLSGCIQRTGQQSNSTQSDEMTLRDSFPDGRPELRWAFFPYFNLDNLEGKRDKDAPDGDNGIGVLSNANAGGFASLSYAATGEVDNFYLEVMVYCPVTEGDKGQLSGIAFLIDPVEGNFYRFVCDFKSSDPTLNIAYVGLDTRNYPVYLKFWDSGRIPGGVPEEEGWHKMAVRVKDGKATAYWDENELEDSPITVDKIPGGFVGVYTNYVGGLGNATTKVDSFILKVES